MKMTFGKYEGWDIKDVPEEYLISVLNRSQQQIDDIRTALGCDTSKVYLTDVTSAIENTVSKLTYKADPITRKVVSKFRNELISKILQ